ncbi:unnamed protein product, partial [Cylicostephanus goldi]
SGVFALNADLKIIENGSFSPFSCAEKAQIWVSYDENIPKRLKTAKRNSAEPLPSITQFRQILIKSKFKYSFKFQKDFIGKDALLKQIERGVSKRFVQLLVDMHDKETDPWPQGGETLDGKPVGQTTTAAYGFTLGCQVCTAYVINNEFGISADFLNRGSYELDIAGKRFPVRVNLHSPSLPMISSEHPLHYRPTQ